MQRLEASTFATPMSALGQKQTFAAQEGMSALPPKADMALQKEMSAKCQKRTSGFTTVEAITQRRAVKPL